MSTDQMLTQIEGALVEMALKPVAASFPEGASPLLGTSAAMQWTIEIAPNLLAELTLIRTSGDDHLLNLITATDSAHVEERWTDVDLFAREMGKAVRPVQLIRNDAELACFVQGRAKGVDGIIALIPELLTMNRYALVTLFDPWIELARGQINLDAAGLKAGAALAKQSGGVE
jgi:hypothetical protein